jgi:hypothetical protein
LQRVHPHQQEQVIGSVFGHRTLVLKKEFDATGVILKKQNFPGAVHISIPVAFRRWRIKRIAAALSSSTCAQAGRIPGKIKGVNYLSTSRAASGSVTDRTIYVRRLKEIVFETAQSSACPRRGGQGTRP